jgi:squalene-hopene/tetraprenyl-beta-curcumene cyclase
MTTTSLIAWMLVVTIAGPQSDVERALRDAPTVPLDARVDASRITRLPPPGVPDRLTPPPPVTRRIAENAADVPMAPVTFDAARASILRGLDFLRRSQSASGGWMEGTPAQGSEAPKVSNAASSAVTGLVLRAFAQAGLLESNDPAVARAVAWLVKACWSADGFEPDVSGGLATYVASCTALGLASLDSPQHAERLREVIAWLRRAQWDQGEGLGPEQDWFGGVGYGSRGRPDLSNTQMMLEALHESGARAEDPAVQRALAFVARCQNVRSEGGAAWANAGGADGGFVYTVANGGESFASEAAGEGRFGEKMPEGTRALRSYGSMTYAGYKSMLFAGLRRDDPRVLAALDWARAHWSMQENPGLGKQGLFYYRLALARGLAASGRDTIQDAGGTPHDWRKELVEALVAAQRPDGSWINDQDRWMEGEPDLVTAYAVLALEEAIKPSRQSQ